MEHSTIIIFAVLLFLMVTLVNWKITSTYLKKKYKAKSTRTLKTNIYYWEGVLFVSSSVTIGLLFLLKWANVLTF